MEISLNPSDYTHFIELHLRNWPHTKEIEEKAKALSANGFEERHLISFIWDVCKWGNYAGIAGRILKQNEISMIRESFISAQFCPVNWLKKARKLPGIC